MLHLLPIRYLLTAIIVLVALVVLGAVYEGTVGTGNILADVKSVFHWASIAALALMFVPYVAWRWVPGLQRIVFPYLGGEWEGQLQFEGRRGAGTREITLTINHSLLKIALILDSAESTSRTLVVHADRDAGINRDRLYYVYINERKEGVVGAGDRYRGLAVLRIEMSDCPALYGDYFTETQAHGRLTLNRRQCHPWWTLWK